MIKVFIVLNNIKINCLKTNTVSENNKFCFNDKKYK